MQEEKTVKGGLPKEDRDTLEEEARVPREQVRERQAGQIADLWGHVLTSST